jgi:hypothetical protein
MLVAGLSAAKASHQIPHKKPNQSDAVRIHRFSIATIFHSPFREGIHRRCQFCANVTDEATDRRE